MNNIPKILHMIWVGDNPPGSYYFENLNRWKELMPGWSILSWTNEKLTNLEIDQGYLSLIQKCRNGAQQADLLKYYLVNKYGGVYVDADVVPKRSLEELDLSDNDIVLCHDLPVTWEYIAVGFFASKPGNPILQYAIQGMFEVDFNDVQQHLTTGPGAMGRAYFYNKESCKVLFLPYYYFYRNIKGDQGIGGELVNEDYEEAFGSHRYACTWNG